MLRNPLCELHTIDPPRYTYGEPVKGTAVVTIQVKSYGQWDSAEYAVIKKTVDVWDFDFSLA